MKSLKEKFTTDAINIKSYPLGDFDNIVVMFSKDYGLIKGIAKGAKRPKSKLGARIQMLVANKLMLKSGKTFDTIVEASALNTFNKTRYDLDKLTFSMYLTELVGAFCKGEENFEKNAEIYTLLYQALENIAQSENKIGVVLNTIKFQLKFMDLIGLAPEFNYCLRCGTKVEGEIYFSVIDGGICCAKCKKRNEGYIKLHKKICEFLTAQKNCEMKGKTPFDELLDLNFTEKCFSLLKKYIDGQNSRPTRIFNVLENIS